MRNPAEHLAKFNESVSILVKAYLNNTLAHKSCVACAVGNLIAHHMGTEPTPDKGNKYTGFSNNVFANGMHECWFNGFGTPEEAVMESYQTEMTGYSVEELCLIEYAFENAPAECRQYSLDQYYIKYNSPIGQNEEWMFNGLMAVVDVLASIHGVDLETTEAARKMFVKS